MRTRVAPEKSRGSSEHGECTKINVKNRKARKHDRKRQRAREGKAGRKKAKERERGETEDGVVSYTRTSCMLAAPVFFIFFISPLTLVKPLPVTERKQLPYRPYTLDFDDT